MSGYPDTPGYKDDHTSRDAAEAIKPQAATIRGQVLDLLRYYPDGLTADEGAAHLQIDFLSVRPRFSELVRQGKLTKTKETRISKRSGKNAAVYVTRKPEQAALFVA